MTEGTLSLVIHGEELVLHPDRAVIWPRRRTVIVADTHFGKTGYFGRHGIAVPAGSDAADRERLGRLVAAAQARRLVILGDFVHAPLTDGTQEAGDLQAWLRHLGDRLELHVVAGNHDRGAARSRLEPLRWWDGDWVEPPFRFTHDAAGDGSTAADRPFTLSGHVHPVVRLRGLAKSALRVPVFWQRAAGLILPSFGLFTGGFAVRPAAGERVYAVGSSGIVALGR